MSPYGASLAAGVKQSLRHTAEPIYMQKWYNGIRYLLKSAETVKEPLPKWAYACMHEHSVGAEWQVEKQQVICTDSVPFPSLKQFQMLILEKCSTGSAKLIVLSLPKYKHKRDLVLYSLADDMSKEPH